MISRNGKEGLGAVVCTFLFIVCLAAFAVVVAGIYNLGWFDLNMDQVIR